MSRPFLHPDQRAALVLALDTVQPFADDLPKFTEDMVKVREALASPQPNLLQIGEAFEAFRSNLLAMQEIAGKLARVCAAASWALAWACPGVFLKGMGDFHTTLVREDEP